MKYRLMLWAVALVAAASDAALTTYDDFASGDLSKWIFTPQSPQRTDPVVVAGELNWGSSAKPAYGNETLLSTKSDFNLTASAADVLKIQIDLVDIVQKTGDPNNSFDRVGLGWQDQDGDILQARMSWRMDDPSGTGAKESALQILYNGSLIGGTLLLQDMAYQAGDVLTLTYDGAAVALVRDRSGSVSTLASRTFSNASFAGTGRILMEANLEGLGGEATIDNLMTETIPEPASMGLLVLAASGILGLRRLML